MRCLHIALSLHEARCHCGNYFPHVMAERSNDTTLQS